MEADSWYVLPCYYSLPVSFAFVTERRYLGVSFLSFSSHQWSPFSPGKDIEKGLLGESQSSQGACDGQEDMMTGANEAFLPTSWERAQAWNRCSHRGPGRGWPRGWNFHYQGLAENPWSCISSGTCNCLLISNNLKHVITVPSHRNESCHRVICFLP